MGLLLLKLLALLGCFITYTAPYLLFDGASLVNDTPTMTFEITGTNVTIKYSLLDAIGDGIDTVCFTLIKKHYNVDAQQPKKPSVIQTAPAPNVDAHHSEKLFGPTCIAIHKEAASHTVTLDNILDGKYLLVAHPTVGSDFPDRELSFSVTHVTHVTHVAHVAPISLLVHSDYHYQDIVAEVDTGRANAHIPFAVSGGNASLFQVCIQISSETDPSVQLSHTCVSTGHTEFILEQLAPGVYVVVLSLKDYNTNSNSHRETTDTTEESFSIEKNPQRWGKSASEVNIEVRRLEEFVPTYDWQRLRAWHTIPSGIETRLPIGSGARKEARIPVPWRLQLSMPLPCKYFLRMDVRRSTTVADIMKQASSQCKTASKKKVSSDCFQLLINGRLMQREETVEGSGLFSAAKQLQLTEACAEP